MKENELNNMNEIELQKNYVSAYCDRMLRIAHDIEKFVGAVGSNWNTLATSLPEAETLEDKSEVYLKVKEFWDNVLRAKDTMEKAHKIEYEIAEKTIDDAVYNANEIMPKMY